MNLLIHALFYLQRQQAKFSEQWQQEYGEIDLSHNLQPYSEFLGLLIDGKWLPLAHDDQSRLKQIKFLNQELQEEISGVQKKLGEEMAKCEEAQIQISVLKSSNSKLLKAMTENVKHSFRLHCPHLWWKICQVFDR